MENKEQIQSFSYSIAQLPLAGESKNYAELLEHFNTGYIAAGYYYQVGEVTAVQGWIIHLSVIEVQLIDLLRKVIPVLLETSVPFKIVRDSMTAKDIINGHAGSVNRGKMVGVYAEDNMVQILAEKLIALTRDFRGPAIPTDFHLGSIVYTRYGSFNPILMQDANGLLIRYIYDTRGNLIPDPYNIPFVFPASIKWPFSEIMPPKLAVSKKLLNNAYYPLSVIKPDAKGDVIKALYFKKIWSIKACLIKQGRYNMYADDHGRDIQDRLRWQNNLYQALGNEIPMPRIFDLFYQDNDCYLAMEFIKGVSITSFIDMAFQNRRWQDLPVESKNQLLEPLISILDIIAVFHQRGYIHRDITPENFIRGPKGKIYLIDLELAWHMSSGQPDPPFRLGTEGFMSPEQYRSMTPTVKEDIFGIGALILIFFTNLPPIKFNRSNRSRLHDQITLLTGEPEIATLISDCIAVNPNQRPSLNIIREKITGYKAGLLNDTTPARLLNNKQDITDKKIKDIIQIALRGLSLPSLVSSQNKWISKSRKKETHVGNEQLDLVLYEGWHTGMAGPLWLIARAFNSGYDVQDCMEIYQNSWQHIDENYFTNDQSTIQGLYNGGPGIALAIVEGIKAGLLYPDTARNYLEKCFSNPSDHPDLASGWAGEGIALLNCMDFIDKDKVKSLLQFYKNNIINSQQSDGSWPVPAAPDNKQDILMGIDRGVAGIILFLLSYLGHHQDTVAEQSVKKALKWLTKNIDPQQKYTPWCISSRSQETDKWGFGFGVPGILFCFIKAYEIFKAPVYKEIAEKYLENIRPYPVHMDFSLGYGLSGLGELYIQAYKTFDNQSWKIRAERIAQLLISFFKQTEGEMGFWCLQASNLITADLFTGNSGAIQYLLDYSDIENADHPLNPVLKNKKTSPKYKNIVHNQG